MKHIPKNQLKHQAREFGVQFLYQCESEKIFHFAESQFVEFCKHHEISSDVTSMMRDLAKGTFDQMAKIDERLAETSENWSLSRMAATDRTVLRMAVYELLESDVPNDVVLNEAIELAKKFGTANSGRFVNGVLDKIAKS